MHIAVLVYGRLNKCVEHHSNIMESLGKNNDIDFFVHLTIHPNHC